MVIIDEFVIMILFIKEPGLLDDLERRLDAAEKKYEEAGIEARLKELYAEKALQVNLKLFSYFTIFKINLFIFRQIG